MRKTKIDYLRKTIPYMERSMLVKFETTISSLDKKEETWWVLRTGREKVENSLLLRNCYYGSFIDFCG